MAGEPVPVQFGPCQLVPAGARTHMDGLVRVRPLHTCALPAERDHVPRCCTPAFCSLHTSTCILPPAAASCCLLWQPLLASKEMCTQSGSTS